MLRPRRLSVFPAVVFYLLIARGEIPIAKVGNRTLILDDDLRTYLARQRVVVERLATE